MRRSKFSESQIVAILKEFEAGVAVAEGIQKAGISRATFFTWRAKYGGRRSSVARGDAARGAAGDRHPGGRRALRPSSRPGGLLRAGGILLGAARSCRSRWREHRRNGGHPWNRKRLRRVSWPLRLHLP